MTLKEFVYAFNTARKQFSAQRMAALKVRHKFPLEQIVGGAD